MRAFPRLGLAGLLALACLAIGSLSWIAVLPLLLRLSDAMTERQTVAALRGRGEMIAAQLARDLYDEWFKLQRLAEFVTQAEGLATLRLRVDTIKAVNADTAWIGYADVSGRVLVASGGILEGEQVDQRPWFRAGTAGPFAGDKHEALLLARFLTARSPEPVRLIDLSLPVRGPDGALKGVLGAHIDWVWVRDLVRSYVRDDLDILLVSRNGDVLTGQPALEGQRLTVHSVVAAGQGVSVTTTERWADGIDYLVTVLPIPGFRDLPSFGWSLVIRQRADAAFGPGQAMIRQAVPVLAGLIVIIPVLSLLVGRALARPLRRLSVAAREMTEHGFRAPVPEERGYREVAELSSALARLQSAAGEIRRGSGGPEAREQ